MVDHANVRDRANRFLLLYALAWAGASISYIPFLTILLPVRVTELVGHDQAVSWLAYVAFAGAVAASAGHIGFGYLSDIMRNRRLWIWGGLTLSCALLNAVPWIDEMPSLIGLVVCWQLAINMMLGPLAAWAGDVVPNDRKGLLGGLMAFAPGLGALSGALVTLPGLAGGQGRLGLVAGLVALFVLPVLLHGAPSARDHAAGQPQTANPEPEGARGAVIRMWLARLVVQVAEATLFAYLFFWLLSLDPQVSDNQTARLFSLIMLVSAPLALAAGRWSDRKIRPILPLVVCALVSALGLLGMALARDQMAAMLAYGLFGLSSAVFLTLHSAQTLRILPRFDRRACDLGLFNLANTMPSLVMPWLTITIVPTLGFPALFALLALLSVAAAVLLRPLASPTHVVRKGEE